MSEMVTFQCPICGRKTVLKKDIKPIGRKKKCKGCQNIYILEERLIVKSDPKEETKQEVERLEIDVIGFISSKTGIATILSILAVGATFAVLMFLSKEPQAEKKKQNKADTSVIKKETKQKENYQSLKIHDLKEELDRIRSERGTLDYIKLLPREVPGNVNAAKYYQKAMELTQGLDYEDSFLQIKNDFFRDDIDHKQKLAEYKKAIDKNQYAIDIILKGVGQKQINLPVEYNSLSGNPGNFNFNKNIFSLLSLKAYLHAADHQHSKAVKILKVMLKVSEHLAFTPNALPLLYSSTIQYQIQLTLRNIIMDTELGDNDVLKGRNSYMTLFRSMQLLNMKTATLNMYKMERAAMYSNFDRLQNGLYPFDSNEKVKEVFVLINSQKEKITRGQLLANIDYDRACYLSMMNTCIQIAKMPYRESLEQIETLEKKIQGLPVCLSKLMITPPRLTYIDERLRCYATIAQIAMAAKLSKKEHGNYPTSLKEFQGKYFARFSLDSFSGKMFQYRRDGKGFVVYSYGKDLKDNNGNVDKDIAWKIR